MLDLDAKRAELLARAEAAGAADLLNDLGALEAMRGAAEEAEAHLRSALLLAPGHEEVASNLAQVLAARRAPAHRTSAPQPAGARSATAVVPVQVSAEGAVDADSGHRPTVLTGDADAAVHEWRRRRLAAIVRHYGAGWFAGARVLELGCGYGEVGAVLLALGADVTFSDPRQEHLDVVAERYPTIPADRLVRYDAEDHWTFEERFDLVLNMDLVNHTEHWRRSIRGAMRAADRLVLETEVCDADDAETVLRTAGAGPDQAPSGIGSRPSAAFVERVLREGGFRAERIADSRCNAGAHRYDWPLTGSGTAEPGLRRFWFAWRA